VFVGVVVAVAVDVVGSMAFEGWSGFGDDTALSAIPFEKLGLMGYWVFSVVVSLIHIPI
jgi:hypothetical protein